MKKALSNKKFKFSVLVIFLVGLSILIYTSTRPVLASDNVNMKLFNEKIEELNNKIGQFDNKIFTLEEKILILETQNEKLQEKINKIETNNTSINKTIDDLKTSIINSNNKIIRLEKNNENVAKAISNNILEKQILKCLGEYFDSDTCKIYSR